MNKASFLLLAVFALFINACNTKIKMEKNGNSQTTEWSYLGQAPPGLKAEVFAPDLVSTKHMEFFPGFTPDLKEFYFKRYGGKYKKPTLVVFQYKNNQWNESVVSPAEASVGEPSVSPDGNIIYLDSRYIVRTNSGWSGVKNLGAPFQDLPIMRLTASSKGTYVFDVREEIGTIRFSRLTDGKFEEPIAFGKEINTGKWIAHPFIAPDESYLIWDSEREGGFGDSDLYISFRQENGSLGPAYNLGKDINTEYEEIFGSVSPDGKYLFFHRYLSNETVNIFWADAQSIEKLREIDLNRQH